MEVGGKKKILVVDDEQTIANSLGWVLDMKGYETRTAYSGEQAVEVAQTFAPDVLICDFFMGGMNGLEAAIQIRDRLPLCKVLLVTGHISITDLSQQAVEKGHRFQYLAKPVHPRTLLEELDKLLQEP